MRRAFPSAYYVNILMMQEEYQHGGWIERFCDCIEMSQYLWDRIHLRSGSDDGAGAESLQPCLSIEVT